MTIKIFDDDGRYRDVEVVWNGGPLPGQKDDDPYWRGAGSLRNIESQAWGRHDFPTHDSVKGKGLAGTAWRSPKVDLASRCGCGRRRVTDRDRCAVCRDRRRQMRRPRVES